jgi:hypothetical protein
MTRSTKIILLCICREAGQSPTLSNVSGRAAPSQVPQALYLGEIRQQHRAEALIAGGI